MKQLVLVLAILFFIAGAACAENLFADEIGGLKIFTLIDAQGEADTKLLIGASDEDIARYVPSGKLKSQILAFLVKLKNYNIYSTLGLARQRAAK